MKPFRPRMPFLKEEVIVLATGEKARVNHYNGLCGTVVLGDGSSYLPEELEGLDPDRYNNLENDFGGYITREGEFIGCSGIWGHINLSNTYLEDGQQEAERLGWISVDNSVLYILFPMTPNKAQLKILDDWVEAKESSREQRRETLELFLYQTCGD